MKRNLSRLFGCALLCSLVASHAYSQRGVGEYEGVARQAVKPDVVTLSGALKGIVIDKYAKQTGPSLRGAHILLISGDGTVWNVHLGPADAVRHVTDRLVVGQEVTAKAFRTDKLPKNNFVAQSLAIDGKSIDFRDENQRPLWAGGERAMRGSNRGRRSGNGPAWGGGRGRGHGPGWGGGAGRGGGQGAGFAQRSRQGRGAGYGQGSGQGYGQGRGNRYRQRRGQ